MRHEANALRFTTSAARAALGETREDVVLVDTVAQEGRVFQVDVYGDMWALVPCPGQRAYACLVPVR